MDYSLFTGFGDSRQGFASYTGQGQWNEGMSFQDNPGGHRIQSVVMPPSSSWVTPETRSNSVPNSENFFLNPNHGPPGSSMFDPPPQAMVTALQSEIAVWKKDYGLLDVKCKTIFAAYIALLRRIPTSAAVNIGPLDRTNYPNAKFWYMIDWIHFHQTGTTDADGQAPETRPSIAMHYIEDQHGNIVEGHSLTDILSFAREVWVELGISGAAPLIWENADMEIKRGFYQAMVAGFFEFRLCDSNWKAEQYAIDNYGLWYLEWNAQTQAASGFPGKRFRNPSMKLAGSSKKLRAETLDSDTDVPVEQVLKKPSKMRPGQSNTARSLCSQDWCRAKGGLTTEFDEYYKNLPPHVLKEYEDRSAEIKRAKEAGRDKGKSAAVLRMM